MIPNSYLTQAQVQALVDSLKMGSGNTTQCDNSIPSTSVPTLNGYITGNLLNAILFSELISNPTYTINEAGLTTQELSYLNGMRARIVEAWADAYADVPLMAPNNARNLRSGQTANNAIDLFLQCIFQFDTRFGARNRLPENNYHGLDAYQLPARSNFVANPYIMTVLGLHGAPDVVSIDDIGSGGTYQVTTTNAHGLYDGMAVYSNGAIGTAATNDILVNSFQSVNDTFTTSGNHNLKDHQRFHAEQPDAGDALFDLQNRFLGYQRRPYVKSESATSFTLYRDYNLTNKLRPTYYTGNLTASSVSGNLHVECGEIQMFIDGLGYTIENDIGEIKKMDITNYNQYTGEFTHTQLWVAPDNGVSIRFTGTAGLVEFQHELFYQKTASNKCKLYWDIDLTRQFYLNRYSATNYSGKVGSTQDSGSTMVVNFTEPHNIVDGAQGRLVNMTGVAYDGQNAITAVVPEYISNLTFTPKYVKFSHSGHGVAVPASGFDYAYTSDGGGTWSYATLPTRLGPGTGTNYWYGLEYNPADTTWTLCGSNTTQDEIYWSTDNGVTFSVHDSNADTEPLHDFVTLLESSSSYYGNMVAGATNYLLASEDSTTHWTRLYLGGASNVSGQTQFETDLYYPRPCGVIGSGTGANPGRFYALNHYNNNTNRSYVYGSNGNWWFLNSPGGSVPLQSRSWDGGATECIAMGSIGNRVIALSKTGGKVFYTDDLRYSGWNSVTVSGISWVDGITNSVPTNGNFFLALCNSGNSVARSTNGESWTTASTPFTAVDIYYDPGKGFVIRDNTGLYAYTIDGYNWITVDGEKPYWQVTDSSVYEDGQIVRLYNGTSAFGSYTADDGTPTTWTAPAPTSTSNYYRVKTIPGYSDRIQMYRDSAFTEMYAPWGTNYGTYTITTLTIQPVFYTKVLDYNTVALYMDSALTNPWYPTTRPELTSQSGDFRLTDLESNEQTLAPSGMVIRPNVYFKTSTYSSVDVYWDRNLTDPVTGTTGTASNTISGVYSMLAQSGSSTWNFATNIELKPVFYVNALPDYPKVFELYVDSGLTIPYNTPAIGTPQTSGSFVVDTYSTSNYYKVTDVFCVNPGSNTYWYKDYAGATEDRVNAQLTSQWFTRNYQQNYCETFPANSLAYEFDPVNNVTTGVGYFGYVRHTKSGSDETTAGGRKGIDTTLYAGVGSPVLISKQYPGRFSSNNPFLLWTRTADDVGTAPSEDPINQNAPEWDEANGVDQALRRWPTHIQPSSVAWSIEQPNQTLESMNYTRYTRSKEITQYRLKLTYRSMTREEFRPFLNIIQAARGSFKPFRYTLPTQADGTPAAFAYQNADSDFPFEVLISRSRNLSGSRVIEIDGLPCERGLDDPVISSGHSISLNTPNTTGQLAMIIHDMATNVYGEANIRVNNAIPTLIDFGHLMDLYPTEVDVFIDGNSIDVSVDTRGYHQFEVELVTKRIF